MKFWKYTQYALLCIAACAILCRMLLLNWYEVNDVHTVADTIHTIRQQYGSTVFYITPGQQSWLNILSGIIWPTSICGGAIALFRGDIRGKRR